MPPPNPEPPNFSLAAEQPAPPQYSPPPEPVRAAVPPPQPQDTVQYGEPIAPPAKPRKKKRRGLMIVLGFLAFGLVGCVAIVAVVAGSATDPNSVISSAADTGDGQPREDVAEAPNDESADGDASSADESEENDDDQQVGTRNAPFALGTVTTVTWNVFGDADNSLWNTTIGELTDITEAVLAENEFNSAPPEGVVFAGFDVEMTLIGAEKVPLSQGFNFGWEIIGGDSNAAYDSSTIETENFGCGVVGNEFESFDEVFLGGTLSGTVCIPIPAADVGAASTAVAMTLNDRVFFSAEGSSPAIAPVPDPEPTFTWTEGTGARSSPFDYDSPTTIEFQTFGDADNSIWTSTVGAPADITAAVLAENQFNEPPPDGTIFAAFDLSMTLDSADVEPLAPAFNVSFQIIGGATAAVYDETSFGFGCGVTANDFGEFDEVFIGGSLTGSVCIPIPTEDLTHPNTRVALKFADDSRVYFGAR